MKRAAPVFPLFVAILAVLTACGSRPASPGQGNGSSGSGGPTASPLVETCRATLPPRGAPLGRPPLPTGPGAAALATPDRGSRLIAEVDLKLAAIAKELEAKIPTRLAEERNRPIGPAGHLNYTVDRGALAVAVEGENLVVRTDVRSHAEACRASGCYAGCDPAGQAIAAVPLRLTSDYRFAGSRVTFNLSRGCELRVLGGLVKIDVTPQIREQMAPTLRRIEKEIDGKLPPVRPQAERLWTEIGKTRQVPLGGCVVTNPRGIVQGPVIAKPGAVGLRFGVTAWPELRTVCPPKAEMTQREDKEIASKLPPLTYDSALPPEDDLVLGLVEPLEALGQRLATTDPFALGPAGRARIAEAKVEGSGASASFDLDLRGDVCGRVTIGSGLAWGADGRDLRLASPAIDPDEQNRVKGAGVAPDDLARALAGVAVPPPLQPEGLKEMVPGLASAASDPKLEVRAKVTSVKARDVQVRGSDAHATVALRSRVELEPR